MMEIENPCYHCYRGAISECLGCKYNMHSYSGDLVSETIEIDNNKITDNIQIIYCKDCRFWDKSHISCEGLARCNTGESGIRYRGGHDFCSKGMLRDPTIEV